MTYWLSKILPLFFLPLGLALILLILGQITRLRWPAMVSAFFLWFFSLEFVSQALWTLLESPWQRRPAIHAPQADAIVVLSRGLHPAPGSSRLIEWHDPDRFISGINLYRHGKAPLLLFTGGVSPFRPGHPPEGQFYLDIATDLGVPELAMASTGPVVNTAQEATAVSKLLPSGSRILLVTSAFHMQRAQLLFERQGLEVLPFPVDFQAIGSWAGTPRHEPIHLLVPTSHALDGSTRALRELMGRILYRIWH